MSNSPSDQGFTLTETLVALLLISLSLAGMLQVARLVARGQDRVTLMRDISREHRQQADSLHQQIRGLEPVPLSRLTGDGRGFRYDCPQASDCQVRAPEGYRLTYVVRGREYPNWPVDSLSEEEASEVVYDRLAGLILYDEKGTVAASVELRIDHPVDCAFDMITRQCRLPDMTPEAGPDDIAQGRGE